MPRYAAIDVGTTSTKMHIGEQRADGTWGVVADRAVITRLGDGLHKTGEIQPDAADRTAASITKMVREANRLDVEAIVAVGTMALRTARNSGLFIARVSKQCGVNIETISGEEESRLSYLAVKSGIGLPGGSIVIFDSGGGSTEFVFGKDAAVVDHCSLEVGAIRFTETYGLGNAVPPARLQQALQAIANDLQRLDGTPAPDTLVGIGGTVTTIASVRHRLAQYDPDTVHGSTIDHAELTRQIELYRTLSAAKRRRIVGLQPERAEVILGGLCIVRTILEKLRKEAFLVSDRGLRHGLLADRFGV